MNGKTLTLDPSFVEKTAKESLIPLLVTNARETGQPVLFANEAFAKLSGYSVGSLKGKSFAAIIQSQTDKEIVSQVLAAMEQGRAGAWEFQCCVANGREILVSTFNAPLRNDAQQADFNVFAMVSSGEGHARLTEERNELHAIYRQAPGFIATSAGPEHVFTFANPSYERFVGRTGLQGQRVADALPEIVDQGFIEVLDRVYETGKPYLAHGAGMDIVDPATGKSARKYADFVYQPVRASDGTITGLFCEGYDTTFQHRIAEDFAHLQAELVQVSRASAMGTMAMTLAHELNQPLSAIRNYAEGARRHLNSSNDGNAALEAAFEGIDGAARRAAEIIKNLRNYTGRRGTSVSDFPLTEAADECVRMVSAAAGPGLTIENAIGDDAFVKGDRIQIQQVLINLLRNACEAAVDNPSPRVSVRSVIAGDQLQVCVTDNGPGLSCDAAEVLFTFSPSTKEGGMGIGLSVSQTIVEAHGGKIWLESSGEAGSEFCFTLPRAIRPNAIA